MGQEGCDEAGHPGLEGAKSGNLLVVYVGFGRNSRSEPEKCSKKCNVYRMEISPKKTRICSSYRISVQKGWSRKHLPGTQ